MATNFQLGSRFAQGMYRIRSKKGVIIGIQNHHDFIKTADQVINIIQQVNSPWCGLILDVGSFRDKEVYSEIKKAIPYAINWQLKETVFQAKPKFQST